MNGQITVNVHTLHNAADTVHMKVYERDNPQAVIASKSFKTNGEVIFNAGKAPERWSPDSPHLYDVEIQVGQDVVRSYMGFRTFQSRSINGVYRPMLNGQFIVRAPLSLLRIMLTDDSSHSAPSTKDTGPMASTCHPTSKP